MQDLIGSVRRSLVLKPSTDTASGLVEKIGSSIRKSRMGLFSKPPPKTLIRLPIDEEMLPPMELGLDDEISPISKENTLLKNNEVSLQPTIRWRKGEMIGCGAFGRVHMGMNLDSGELLAVKEVAIATNSASKKTQEYIWELEKEVNLLKNLSHPNIVRYLGTAREEDSLNILLEFVPGGSIASLLGKFGSFPESVKGGQGDADYQRLTFVVIPDAVIRMYTKQLLLGLVYLHDNNIMHRDIKGANILVDNKGCIKLADFGASKKVEALATITGAKSMKGTPYWMAPEVIVQSGHSYSADIWSVGCTVIEMATGKAPWSQQYQEVAALFHVGTTKSHPPIPDHLSIHAKDFLLKCLHKEPDLRPTASELLKHPFVTGDGREFHSVCRSSVVDDSGKRMASVGIEIRKSMNGEGKRSCYGLKDVGTKCSTMEGGSLWQPGNFNDDDDMCQIDDQDDFVLASSIKVPHTLLSNDCNQSFNPMSEPNDDWTCKFDERSELNKSKLISSKIIESDHDFRFPTDQSIREDDDEVTESKIRDFLDEKAVELKRLQSPLYEFYNSLNVGSPSSPDCTAKKEKENISSNCNLPPKSKSPSKMGSRRFSTAAFDVEYSSSPDTGSCSRRASNISDTNIQASLDVKEILLDSQRGPSTPRFSEIQKKWKEELDEELDRKREQLRQAGTAKTSSPNDRALNRQRDRLRFASP